MRSFLLSLFCVSQFSIVQSLSMCSLESFKNSAKWLCYGNYLTPSKEEDYFMFPLSPYLTFKPLISKSSSFLQNSSFQVKTQRLSKEMHYISPNKFIK